MPEELVTQQEEAEESGAEEEAYVDDPDRSDEGFELVWSDEFDGDSLDTSKWFYQYGTGSQYGLDGWGNSELEYYTDRTENVRVEDGKLILTAIKEETPYEGMQYTSGRIRTVTDDETLFATTYGRVEARIKMPAGEGIWPAFWMLPADDSIYGGWAASGEIDIMEARGRLPGTVGGTLHYGGNWPNNTYKGMEYNFPEGTDISDYHLYSLEWEPGQMRWYVDDECYFTFDDWYSKGAANATDYSGDAPYDVPFYILLNLAVGGTYDSVANLERAEFPAVMEVDFVRVYHKADGYESVEDAEAAEDDRDTEGFASYAESYTDGEFITDKEFTTMNTTGIIDTDNRIIPESKDWQFAVGSFGGAAKAQVEELDEGSFARVDITRGGNYSYAVQLIQHLPLIEGYAYQISFDAKASEERSFVLSPSGDGDNAWVKYASFDVSVGTEVESYSYVFTMKNATDPTARLEFNIGLAKGTIWIGNVSVTLVESEGGVDPDMKKTPLGDGNLIYNGTFDQGQERLAFWHMEGMKVEVPDYVVREDGTADYSRMAELTALEGQEAKLYQTGLQLAAQTEYSLSLDVDSAENTTVQLVLAGESGVQYLDVICNGENADGTESYEAKFTTGDSSEQDAVLTVLLPEEGFARVDNIRMDKLP